MHKFIFNYTYVIYIVLFAVRDHRADLLTTKGNATITEDLETLITDITVRKVIKKRFNFLSFLFYLSKCLLIFEILTSR